MQQQVNASVSGLVTRQRSTSADSLRGILRKGESELNGASSNTLSELCALRTASHDAKARGRPEHARWAPMQAES